MKIKVALNQKSIKQAIKQLEKAKKQLNEMLNEFYNECYEYFKLRANHYVINSGIGSDVIFDIIKNWQLVKTTTGAKIVNTSDKAVFVEFGVGVIGEQNSHPNAKLLDNDYEYNIPTPYKRAGKFHTADTWRFYQNDEDAIDLKKGYYEVWETSQGDIKVITEGSPAVMYAFNALQDLKAQIKPIWESIKYKYWG